MANSKRGGVNRGDFDVRRMAALVISLLLLSIALVTWWSGSDSSTKFFSAASARIGIVLGALWLAWPSLKRPAKWLPASAPVIGVLALLVVAAQPRLIVPAIPIVGGLITLSAIVAAFRKRR